MVIEFEKVFGELIKGENMDECFIKPEGNVIAPPPPAEEKSTPKRRGRAPSSRGGINQSTTAKRQRKSATEKISATAAPSPTPSKGGGARRSRGRGAAAGTKRASVTKAAKSATLEEYNFTATIPDSPDEAEDAEDSEYAPSDEDDDEPAPKTTSKRRRSSPKTRQQKAIAQDEDKDDDEEDDEDDEDEEDEDEDDDDDDDDDEEDESDLEDEENRFELIEEVTKLNETGADASNLFIDDDDDAAAVKVDKDIYDFDAQSIISAKQFKKIRRQGGRRTGVGGKKPSTAARKVATGVSNSVVSASWGSNIYSALATSLKTRADLDAYTNFLKCPYLNHTFDNMFVDICQPSNQHAVLFFGPSASLQSLMGRVNDPDRVVELLHAFMSKPYDNLANRILWFAPMMHQQPFPFSNIPSVSNQLSSIASSLDPKMRIEPAYLLDSSLNVLVQTGASFTDLVVSLGQYNAINSVGNVGRFMTDVQQIVVSSDFYDNLNDLVALPYEQIMSYAGRSDEDASVHIDALEPPCLQRLVAAVNNNNQLIGIAQTDTWDISKVPLSRTRQTLQFPNLERGPIQLSQFDKVSHVTPDFPIVLDTYSVMESVIDSISANQTRDDAASKGSNVRVTPKLGRIHLMDCFLVKPNGRKDILLLICFEPSSNPPLQNRPTGACPFKIYSIVDEEQFFFSRFGISSDLPALMDGMFTGDPETITERKSLAVIPDILFNNLKSVCLREIVASSGTAVVNACLTQLTPVVTQNSEMYQCSKFILVDSQRRVPLAVVFEAPIRLSWSSEAIECAVRSPENTIDSEFNSIGADVLTLAETNFDTLKVLTECRLVAINGIMYALQVDNERVVQRIIELVPASYENITGHPDRASLASQSITGDARSCSAFVRVINEENHSAHIFPAVYFPHYNQNVIIDQLASFCDELVDHLYTSPVAFSLYDVVFRMALKHTPKMLARQHREAAEAAVSASFSANPHEPAPAPVPLPEHWGVCSICFKELHSVCGLLEHELRHLGLTRFRCPEHGICFADRRALETHMGEHTLHKTNVQNDAGDDGVGDEDLYEEKEEQITSGLTSILAKAISTYRMGSQECEHCHDYFPTADVMVQHLEICDSTSFKQRSPIDEPDPEGTVLCVCGVCGQSTNNIETHFTAKHLTCVICDCQLHTIEELSYHYKIHVDSSKDKKNNVDEVTACVTCLNFYSTKHNYYFHQWAEHGIVYQRTAETDDILTPVQARKPCIKSKIDSDLPEAAMTKLKCKFCNFMAPASGRQYVDHLAFAHNFTTAAHCVCRLCADIFATGEELSGHLQEQHLPLSDYSIAGAQTIYSCDQCTFFAFVKGLQYHAREVHNDFAPMMYRCPYCSERFSDRRVWRSHLAKHPEGFVHSCNECGKDFRSRQALMNHIQTRHIDWESGPVTCEHCGITYPKQSALRYHIARMHNQDLQHECPICSQRFRIETYLRRHMKETHSGSIQCEICHKMCANLRCYSQHRQKHFRTKIFQCKECAATFKSKTAMRRHVRVEHMQLGPEKFECQICGKIVTQIGMHMLTHKDARFECEYCGKRFTKSVYYNEHIRIHRGELPFECHICGRRFNKKSNLNVHIRFHEKHRDEEGNYLQLKARGRISTMFGDASLTAEERAAKDLALRTKGGKSTVSVGCGSDYPGAFNVGGRAGAAAEAAALVCPNLADAVGLLQPPSGSAAFFVTNGGGSNHHHNQQADDDCEEWQMDVNQSIAMQ